MLVCVYMSYVWKACVYDDCTFDICIKCFLEHDYMYDMLLEAIWYYCMIMRCKSMMKCYVYGNDENAKHAKKMIYCMQKR